MIAQSADDIVRRGVIAPVRWLPTPRRGTMIADPAWVMRDDGRQTVFAEFLDYRRPRGEIWSASLPVGADLARAQFRPCLSAGHHMSYPFPFIADDGEPLLTAESWEAGAAMIWREQAQGWAAAGTLLAGFQAVDPTLWRGDDRWWLFCTLRDDDPDGRLHLFHARRLGEGWTPHPANPVKTGHGGSRPAGPLFRCGDQLIRPAQDCTRTYGGAVVLHAVRRLDPGGFAEEPVRRIELTGGAYPHGPHTLFPAGNETLIDGKRWQFDPGRLIRRFLRQNINAPCPGARAAMSSGPGSIAQPASC